MINFLIVGYGVQGKKRAKLLKRKNYITVDKHQQNVDFKNIQSVPKNFYDVIISNNTVQHCENPFLEINNLYNSLKKNGKIILITGCSSKNLKYRVNDINYQLYSFSPMNLGNILDANGFEVIKVEKIQHRWIPKYIFFYKLLGRRIFNFLCYIFSFFDDSIINIIAISKK